ncbi:hypothetical protein FKW77_006197 [Venturia effusa]|uniref:tRNA(His) guanylyltransferase n=1 Tax=Venturia effusa TaxID=50376 RepID=A0A517L5I0_9PEZI|nr:hypothetical protein FKW77_006197 [Venturia effusa]
MANSQYEYVKAFERDEVLLPNTWIVVRIDGRGFHRFTTHHSFTKPNDLRALQLMNASAQSVMHALPDVVLAYGISDEYSFVFHKDTSLFQRRSSKILSTVVSTFTAYYVALWSTYFPDKELMATTGGHINNLFNTTFWALIDRAGLSNKEAEQRLSGTLARDKNELLFRMGINYDREPPIFKRGSALYWDYELLDPSTPPSAEGSKAVPEGKVAGIAEEAPPGGSSSAGLSKTAAARERRKKAKAGIAVWHGDVIQDEFWRRRSWILSGRAGRLKAEENGASASLHGRSGPPESSTPNGNHVEHAARGLV